MAKILFRPPARPSPDPSGLDLLSTSGVFAILISGYNILPRWQEICSRGLDLAGNAFQLYYGWPSLETVGTRDNIIKIATVNLTNADNFLNSSDLESAYRSAFSDATAGSSRLEKTVDKLESMKQRTSTGNMVFLRQFYDANKTTIMSAYTSISSLEPAKLDQAITDFSQTAKVVIQGLDNLAKIHPFVAVAVVAFKLVISLDLTRRENNQKVMALRLQMQDMMCTLFQLRNIEDPETVGPDDIVLKDRLQPLIQKIATDIRECGSACDIYLRKSFLARTLKSKIYEGKLAAFAGTFVQNRDALNDALTVHMALGIDTANQKLDRQDTALQSIEGKLDALNKVFSRLNTLQEIELEKYINDNGGPKVFVDDDKLLKDLVERSGQSLSDLSNEDGEKSGGDLATLRSILAKELTEDLDALIKKNMVVFEGKLDLQSRQLGKIEMQGDYIIATLMSGAHQKIKDQDLQNLWHEMGWKGSVKARHFVLSLRDYYTDQFNAATPLMSDYMVDQVATRQHVLAESPGTMSEFTNRTEFGLAIPISNDRWALHYIDPRNLRNIIEATDVDGTGFITIKEANIFAMERPSNWTLLEWLAYWAEGWQTTLPIYQGRIYFIIQEMHRKLDYLLPCNRLFAERYLSQAVFSSIEQLLRSTKHPEPTNSATDFDLLHLTKEHMDLEENRLKHSLEIIKYMIDNSATVSLVTGNGRIERLIHPLLFLVLKRHLQVFAYASNHVVSSDEFPALGKSLNSIFELVYQRITDLQAISRHVQRDMVAYLNNFSFGMFSLLSSHGNSGDKRDLEGSTLLSQPASYEGYKGESETDRLPVFTADSSLDTFHFEWPCLIVAPPPDQYSFDEDKPDGFWAGYVTRTRGRSVVRFCQFCFEYLPTASDLINGRVMVEEGEITGEGVTANAMVIVKGRYRVNRNGTREIDLIRRSSDVEGAPAFRLTGAFDPSTQTLSGIHTLHDGAAEARGGIAWFAPKRSSEEEEYVFHFRRTPGEVYRYRYHLNPNSERFRRNPARARWSFLRQAVLFYVHQRMGSWWHIKVWSRERREFMNLSERKLLTDTKFALAGSFAYRDRKKVYEMEMDIPPIPQYLYRKLVTWRRDHTPYHFGPRCDNCKRKLLYDRYICIVCTQGLAFTVGTCLTCVDRAFDLPRLNFKHLPSHTLIKSGSYLLPHYKARVFAKAKVISVNLKEIARQSLEEEDEPDGIENETTSVALAPRLAIKPGGGGGGGQPVPRRIDELKCEACKQSVYLPFWACLTCNAQILLCNDCQGKSTTRWGETHTMYHHLLQIHNTIPESSNAVEKLDPTISRINALEGAVKDRLKLTDAAINNQAMETLKRLADVDDRISKLEQRSEEQGELLRRIVRLLEGFAASGGANGRLVVDSESGRLGG